MTSTWISTAGPFVKAWKGVCRWLPIHRDHSRRTLLLPVRLEQKQWLVASGCAERYHLAVIGKTVLGGFRARQRRRDMARTWSFVWVLLPAAALAPAAPALKDRAPKEAPIFGEWFRVGHTQAGAPAPVDREEHHQMCMPDGVWQYSYGGRADGSKTKSFVTDARQSPATIDIHLDAGGRPNWRGIYKVEGDTLTLCL